MFTLGLTYHIEWYCITHVSSLRRLWLAVVSSLPAHISDHLPHRTALAPYDCTTTSTLLFFSSSSSIIRFNLPSLLHRSSNALRTLTVASSNSISHSVVAGPTSSPNPASDRLGLGLTSAPPAFHVLCTPKDTKSSSFTPTRVNNNTRSSPRDREWSSSLVALLRASFLRLSWRLPFYTQRTPTSSRPLLPTSSRNTTTLRQSQLLSHPFSFHQETRPRLIHHHGRPV